jgi:uncharacterized repeat protein (TIGR02543 family)
MKKLFKILTLSTMCLGMPLLNACSFFRGNDSKVTGIKEILVDYDEDGNALITINYTDSHKEPVSFVLPKGTDGEVGTGIKKVDYEQDEYGATTVTISFTGDKLDPVSFVLEPGKSISDVKFDTDAEGNTLIIFMDSDGNELSPITVFKGDSGVGIASIISEIDPDTGETIVSMYMSDDPDKENPVVVRIPQGKTGKGITSIVSEKRGSMVYLTINYTEGEPDIISFDAAPAWTTGYSMPNNTDGYDGDYYFDIEHDVIYIKENGRWNVAVDFNTNAQEYTVSFNLNDTNAEPASLVGNRSYVIRKGETFYSSNYTLPIATRSGYTFGGWSTSKTPNVTNGIFTDLTPVLSDMTLYAVWTE